MGTKVILPQQCLLHTLLSHSTSPRAPSNAIPRSFRKRKEVPRRPRQLAPVVAVRISKSGSSIKTSVNQEIFNQNARDKPINYVVDEEKSIQDADDEKKALRELKLQMLQRIQLGIVSSNLPLTPKIYAGHVAAQPPSPKDLPQPRFVRGGGHGRTNMATLPPKL